MKRLSPKKKIIGIGSWIKRTAESEWERVGQLFNNRGEARKFVEANYKPFATKIAAIRMVITPRQPGACWADQRA